MTDREFFNLISKALFVDKSCKTNTWYTIVINGRPICEAMINSHNFIHIRKPIKKIHWYINSDNAYLYKTYRFNRQQKLVYAGIAKGEKPTEENKKEITI